MAIQVTHLDARGLVSTNHQAWITTCEPGDFAIVSMSHASLGVLSSLDGWTQLGTTTNNSAQVYQSVFYKWLEPSDGNRYHSWSSSVSGKANVGTIVLRNVGGMDGYTSNTIGLSTGNTFPAIGSTVPNTYHVNLTAVRVGTAGVSMTTPAGWTTQFNQATLGGSPGFQNVVNTIQTSGSAQSFPTVSASMGSSVYKSNYRLMVYEKVATEFRGWGIPMI